MSNNLSPEGIKYTYSRWLHGWLTAKEVVLHEYLYDITHDGGVVYSHMITSLEGFYSCG